MKIPILNTDTIEQLRGFFHPKDRSVILADDTFIEGEEVTTPGNPRHNRGRLYWKNSCWTQLDENGNETAFCNSWQDWTPTVTQVVAVGVTVNYARYTAIGDTVHILAEMTMTGAGTGGAGIIVGGLPLTIAASSQPTNIIGVFSYLDFGNTRHNGIAFALTGTTIAFYLAGTGASAFGTNPNFAIAANDRLGINLTYEQA